MDKEFLPYQQALELKELGFNEPCIMAYIGKDKQLYSNCDDFLHLNAIDVLNPLKAPTFSQAFRWFREKYGYLHHIIYFDPVKAQTPGKADYQGAVLFPHQEIYYLPKESYNTYEETELACLIKLIEIVKDGKVQTN